MRIRSGHSELFGILKRCRSGFFTVAAFSALLNLLMLVSPIYMMQVYDRVLTARSAETLVALSLLAMALLAVMVVIETIRSRILVRMAGNLEVLGSERVLNALFRANLVNPGRSASQGLGDFDTVRQFLSGPALLALLDAPWAPLLLAAVFLFHPGLGVIAVLGGLIVLALALTTEFLTRSALREANGQAMCLNRFIDAGLRNAEIVRSMGMGVNLERRWLESRDQILGLQARASDHAGLMKALSKASRLLLQIAVVGVGAYLAINGQISAGAIIAASIVMGRALAPLESAIATWPLMVGARDAYARLNRLFEEFPEEPSKTSLPAPKGKLAVENLIAAPPGSRAPILKKISFSVPAGQVVGVFGRSGVGKSTLARTLIGAWGPIAGSVRLDDAEVGQWACEELGRYIGYLPQDIELFQGSVSDNIARFDAGCSENVILAAQRAYAHEMILALPNGYDTPIGPGGCILSGGQRQRIALARALYGNPALIVLDEPSTHLDEAGESALLASIAEMRERGATVVAISHRPSLINATDLLLVLSDGAVASFGPRDEILEKYRRPRVVIAPQASAVVAQAGAV